MIAELVKENENYTYRIKSKREVILESRSYKRKITAVRGFKRFNNSVKSGRIIVCNDIDCYHIEIKDASNKIIAESVNLNSKNRLRTLKRGLRRRTLILKDIETKKMRTYIQNIGDIRLKEPLTVDIEKSEDFVASINKLNLFAYGENLEEVMTELKEDLEDLYDDLFSGKYDLAKPAIGFKNYIENLIR